MNAPLRIREKADRFGEEQPRGTQAEEKGR